jgi:hypothetical protein
MKTTLKDVLTAVRDAQGNLSDAVLLTGECDSDEVGGDERAAILEAVGALAKAEKALEAKADHAAGLVSWKKS